MILEKFRIEFLFFFIALGITFFHAKEQYIPNLNLKIERHNQVLTHSAENLYNYRVLPSLLTEPVYKSALLFINNSHTSYIIAFCFVGVFVYWFTLLSIYKFFSENGLEEVHALISCLLWVAVLPISLTGWDEIGDILNLCLFASTFRYMIKGSMPKVVLCTFIASWNKEQSVLLPIFYLVGFSGGEEKQATTVKNTVIIVAAFFISTVMLHLFVGQHQHSSITSSYFGTDFYYNINNPEWLIVWLLSLGIFVVFIPLQWKKNNNFLRRNVVITLPLFYVLIFFIRARMREIDKAFILHLFLIPMAVRSLLLYKEKRERNS